MFAQQGQLNGENIVHMKPLFPRPQYTVFRSVLIVGICLGGLSALEAIAKDTACRVVLEGTCVELRSPFFVFQLDTRSGLRAEAWENRLTGQTISLGNGSELDVDIGPLSGPLQTPHWEAASLSPPTPKRDDNGDAVFQFISKEPALSAISLTVGTARNPCCGSSFK